MFGDAVFELVDTEDNEKIEFGEFVQATFCYFWCWLIRPSRGVILPTD